MKSEQKALRKWQKPWIQTFVLTYVTSKIRSMSTSFCLSLCNDPSYYNVKFKWNLNKRHGETEQKPQKRSMILTSVTVKSRSRSTILMPALPHALRNIYVKFDCNPLNSLWDNVRTKDSSGDGGGPWNLTNTYSCPLRVS